MYLRKSNSDRSVFHKTSAFFAKIYPFHAHAARLLFLVSIKPLTQMYTLQKYCIFIPGIHLLSDDSKHDFVYKKPGAVFLFCLQGKTAVYE